jgi:serine/threonine-protein kinase
VLGGRYVIAGLLRAGIRGSVYLAAQPALAREVAIKAVPADRAHSLDREAVAASRVGHPGSITIHDTGRGPGGEAFLVMPHVRGRRLSEIIDEEPVPVVRALAIADQLVAVLEAAHDAGVVHGDLTSTNVLVEETGTGDRVVVIDYSDATYDAARQPTGVSSDIRAVGVLLYEMITGSTGLAWQGGKLLPVAVRRPELEIPAALDYAVMRALEPDAQRRFPTAEAMRRSLKTIDCSRVLPRYHRSTALPRFHAEGSGARRVVPQQQRPVARSRRPSPVPDELLLAPRD